MCFTSNSCDKRPADVGPACNVHRSDMVGVISKPTRLTNELGLALAIGLVDVAARWASPRSVTRIYGHEFDASDGGLVAEERAQLKERPSRVHRSLVFSGRYPVANSRQVFNGNPSPGAFSLRDDLLRDHVISVGTKTGLLAREFFEVTLRRLCADRLEHVAQTLVALAHGLDDLSTVGFTIGVDGKVSDTEVDTEPAFWIDWRTIRNINGHVKKPLSLAKYEVGLSSHTFKTCFVIRATDEGNKNATRDGQERNTIHCLKAQNSLVVGNGRMFSKTTQLGLIPLICPGNLVNCEQRHLSRQPKLLAHVSVVKLLQLVLVRRSQLKRSLCQPITRFVHSHKCRQQQGSLLKRRKQFCRGNKFHFLEYDTLKSICQPKTRRDFLPALKDGDSVPKTR